MKDLKRFLTVGMVVASTLAGGSLFGQAAKPAATPSYVPIPGFDPTSLDRAVDPCTDFYQFACGKFAANHPIPADEGGMGPAYVLMNVNTQWLRGILEQAEAGGSDRSADAQKIGDYYKACMDTDRIERLDLAPIQPLLAQIDALGDGVRGKLALPGLIGSLQREGVDVFFSFGEQQDYKDASKQIAYISQGGLGMPEKDYYLRTGAKDEELRKQYVAHIVKMLTFAGSSPQQALRDANAVMAFETALAKGSMGVVDLREPEKTYHLQTISAFTATVPGFNLPRYEEALHAPHVTEINNSTPDYFPVLLHQVRDTDMSVLKAYMRYHLLTAYAGRLPKRIDAENFDFYGVKLYGQPEQAPRWKRCSRSVDGALAEALGKVYVDQYFAGESKQRMVVMVKEIEDAMDRDIDTLTWMSPETKLKAKAKLKLVANKIGYPDKWRDYSALTVKPDDAFGNSMRANEFSSAHELAKIGKPVDPGEWDMSPPTVNAYYNPSMNDINFPAGILQPPYFDPKADDAVNYGDIGGVIGHELTHGFDDQGKKFDGKGNLSDWWTAADTKGFEARTDCLVKEYDGFTAVKDPTGDVKVNGKLTLGENTADNGGLVLAYMAYLEHAKKTGVDLTAKVDGFTAPQRFYIGYAQGWCENSRPEQVRSQVLADPHAPDHIRVNGAIVNQPGFAGAFSCKVGTPMVPANSCRVW
ncbi:endothelin-converting enzyme/putative endopeptidase [Granulicella rosea]|uniref:Endothelin-converting enzyme/putative endopeptidase n=1 Tax=Granulicella rosea TaxID=474952 RepID=A0A239L4A4_9BACT|nr:M13 family metallopeptidase [Granulicella rosea]SNT25271.1 endothelin-converting enzyme/putative endopeptidase [Granulicella rosea]